MSRRLAVRPDAALLRALVRRARRAARRMGVSPRELSELGLRIVDDQEMSELHLRYMNEAGPTDVLSFVGGELRGIELGGEQLEGDDELESDDELEGADELEHYGFEGDDGFEADDELDDDSEAYELEGEGDLGEAEEAFDSSDPGPGFGDVVIDWQAVQRQASSRTRAGLLDEATVLLVHGLAHLLGHDHRTREQSRRMHRLERRGLHALGVADPPRPYAPRLLRRRAGVGDAARGEEGDA